MIDHTMTAEEAARQLQLKLDESAASKTVSTIGDGDPLIFPAATLNDVDLLDRWSGVRIKSADTQEGLLIKVGELLDTIENLQSDNDDLSKIVTHNRVQLDDLKAENARLRHQLDTAVGKVTAPTMKPAKGDTIALQATVDRLRAAYNALALTHTKTAKACAKKARRIRSYKDRLDRLDWRPMWTLTSRNSTALVAIEDSGGAYKVVRAFRSVAPDGHLCDADTGHILVPIRAFAWMPEPSPPPAFVIRRWDEKAPKA